MLYPRCKFLIKYFLLFPVSLLMVETAIGQGVHPGVEVNLSYSSLSYEDPLEFWDPRGDFNIGAAIISEYQVVQDFLVRTGARLSRVKNRVAFGPTSKYPALSKGEFSITHRYASSPAHLLYFVRGGSAYLLMGPEVGYLLSAKSESSSAGGGNEDITSRMNRWNLSIALGIGIRVRKAGRQLYGELRLNRGLTNVAQNEGWATNWKTQEIGLGIGYVY